MSLQLLGDPVLDPSLVLHHTVHDPELTAGVPREQFEIYLTLVERDFNSLRRVMHGLSAVLLLVHSTRAATNRHLEISLTDLSERAVEIAAGLHDVAPRYGDHRAHRVLLRAVELVQLTAEHARRAFEAPADDRPRAVARALEVAQSAYSTLEIFTTATPWHVLSLSNGCACTITEESP